MQQRIFFVDSSDGHCYLFDKNGNEDDIKKLKKIDNNTFYKCESLTSIVIPDSVKSIGNWAFTYCENLKSIVIPDSFKSIGHEAFAYCKNLKSLSFKGKTLNQVELMEHYPFGIVDESIIGCI